MGKWKYNEKNIYKKSQKGLPVVLALVVFYFGIDLKIEFWEEGMRKKFE